MCGIAGIYSFPPQPSLSPQVERMLQLEEHRGPDDKGTWEGHGVALGNLRLAIVDQSPAAHQPMSNEDGSLWCILNGEIYNYQMLQGELKSKGHAFHSNSDTEVVVHGYEEWGLEVVKRLRGMFAIALWSEREQRLVLMRDRFGIKPIYYHFERQGENTRLLFASEIKPILSQIDSAPRPNPRVLHDLLAYGLLDHTEETAFEGIAKIPPAHYVVVDRRNPMTATRYWDFQVNSDYGTRSPESDVRAAEEFRQAFFDSVRHHLVSDVPVGSCLSGGLDSSSVVCAANQLIRNGSMPAMIAERQKTFTSYADDPRIDERAFAHLVAQATGVQEHYISPTCDGFREELSQLIRFQEEPFASTSAYAQWCLMRAVRQSGIKVILDGQGGDEQLLGYGKFYFFFLRDLWRSRRVGALAREGLGLAGSVDFLRTLYLRQGLNYLGRRGQSLGGAMSLLNPAFHRLYADRAPDMSDARGLGDRIKLDLTTFSLPVLLRYEDKNSSAFSVEARTPFVDHVIAETIAAMPINQKLRGGWTKYVLRQGMKGILPEPIRLRKTKVGFATPEESWFRGGLARDLEEAFRSPCFIQDYADLPSLQEQFRRYQARPGWLSGRVFFRYYITEMWGRQFILNPSWDRPSRV